MNGAQAMAQSPDVSVVVFLFAAIGVVLFAAKVVVYAVGHRDTLFPLRVSLGGLSLFFGLALAYESYAVLRGRTTISMASNSAFVDRPAIFVLVFSAIMAVIGLLAVHFTRLASSATVLVSVESFFSRYALLAVIAVGIVLVVITEAVIRLTDVVDRPSTGDATVSWWVLFVGGSAYAIGSLISWATNWRPH